MKTPNARRGKRHVLCLVFLFLAALVGSSSPASAEDSCSKNSEIKRDANFAVGSLYAAIMSKNRENFGKAIASGFLYGEYQLGILDAARFWDRTVTRQAGKSYEWNFSKPLSALSCTYAVFVYTVHLSEAANAGNESEVKTWREAAIVKNDPSGWRVQYLVADHIGKY